jgi:hypothetical protein
MTHHRWIGSPAIASLLGLTLALLASACGGASSSAKSPNTAASPSAALTPMGSPPPGGPVPAQLLGVWLLHTPNPDPGMALDGIINGQVQLTLTPTTYSVETLSTDPIQRVTESGAVVVNTNEIDFFTETSGQPFCHLQLPDGVGRYKWTLIGGVLHFATVVASGYFGDPCGRLVVADQSYIRAK